MMKYFLVILSIIFLLSCNDKNAPGCFKTTGDVQEYTIEVDEFSSIDIHNNIHIVIEQGTNQLVKLTTGTNLVNDINFEVLEGELVIKDLNKCNWVRNYSDLNVHIITPELSKIRSSGGGIITSKGTLRFINKLALVSELYTGDFILNVDMQSLQIVNNDLSNYFITGNVTNLNVGFYAGDGRFEGSGLIAENAIAFQRGTNDMIINATQSLNVELRSTGNVIYCTEPNTINVEIIDDRGKLIRDCQ